MKVYKWWVNYQIKRSEKAISQRVLNLYFDSYTGETCIDADNYERDRIKYLKSLL